MKMIMDAFSGLGLGLATLVLLQAAWGFALTPRLLALTALGAAGIVVVSSAILVWRLMK